MRTRPDDAVSLPVERPKRCPFDPPEEFAPLREERPLARMRYPDGHLGWLVSGHRLVRAVLADSRFSSRYELMHHPLVGEPSELPPATIGDMTGIDPPEHTRYRQLLTGKFTVRRMRQLTTRVEQIVAGQLDAMEHGGPPVDLVHAYAQPVPALLICELLGVPYADRGMFQRHATTLMSQTSSQDEIAHAMNEVHAYIRGLVVAKRADPTDDMLSDLTASEFSDDELAGVGGLLLVAGSDTTASMLGLGTFALLRNPDQFALLSEDPSSVEQAVEELLRYLTIADPAARSALEDVELDGQVIRAGESVTLSLQAANRDPERFPEPDTLDLSRRAVGHLAFGHGIHQCLGQQLARVTMRVAFLALVRRFPTLRLAVAPEDVPMRANTSIYGVQRLPVSWEV